MVPSEEGVPVVDAVVGEDGLDFQQQFLVQADELTLLKEVVFVLNRSTFEIKTCLLNHL